MEARTGKYFQVILPKDLHTAPEEIQYASLDVLTHAATLELVTSTTSQNSVINTLELARYQLSHYTLLCKAQANHIITQNKRDTQIHKIKGTHKFDVVRQSLLHKTSLSNIGDCNH